MDNIKNSLNTYLKMKDNPVFQKLKEHYSGAKNFVTNKEEWVDAGDGIEQKKETLQDKLRGYIAVRRKENPPEVAPVAPVENKIQPLKVQPIKALETEVIGTNYDPFDPDQTRPGTDGRGAAGVIMDETMVATPRKKGSDKAMLRLGTVVYVPELNDVFVVADLTDRRFDGMMKLDFVKPNMKKAPDPVVNKNFSGVQILREGGGYEDARNFIQSGEWQKLRDSIKNS
jgi:3D (Asp-Asp-Asp) domain-containing protein